MDSPRRSVWNQEEINCWGGGQLLTTRTGSVIELYPVRQGEDSHVMFQKAVMSDSDCRCLIVGLRSVTNLGSVTLRFPPEWCLPVSESLILFIPKSGGRWGSTTLPPPAPGTSNCFRWRGYLWVVAISGVHQLMSYVKLNLRQVQ